MPVKTANYFTTEKPKDNLAFIMRISNNNDSKSGNYITLPFFPESLSDSKAVNWSSMEYPGGSHPIYQYVNSGERTITFTAKLLRETKPQNRAYDNRRLNPFSIDINDAVKFLRSCLYPQGKNNNSGGATVISAPPICKIRVGGSNFDSGSGLITCIMTQCDVEVSRWWDDNKSTPKIAEVSLAFSEIINVFGKVDYVFSDDIFNKITSIPK